MKLLVDKDLAETVPDGTFGHSRPAPHRSPWTPAEQDRHWQALCHAVGTPNAQRPTPASPN